MCVRRRQNTEYRSQETTGGRRGSGLSAIASATAGVSPFTSHRSPPSSVPGFQFTFHFSPLAAFFRSRLSVVGDVGIVGDDRVKLRFLRKRSVSLNERRHHIGLIIHNVVDTSLNRPCLNMLHPFARRFSAMFGTSLAKGDPSPAARNNGTLFGSRCSALNLALTGNAR